MKALTVRTGTPYDIQIAAGALSELTAAVRSTTARKVAVVTDQNVWTFHAGAMEAALSPAGRQLVTIVLEPGETSKSFAVLQRICGELVDQHFGRGDLLIAFGGGVVGDVCGFAAAVYMRGVDYIQVPTTLLAQVDSSVGGKTAVNIPQGKNLVGAFYQPRRVIIDTRLLRTLPDREWKSGMAEVIKYGAIASRELFDILRGLRREDEGLLEDVILTCCRLKSELVEQDERDYGLRMLLNFGHTFGHAVEALGQFERHTHGEAVAMGMALAAELGCRLGMAPREDAEALGKLMAVHGLQTACPYRMEELLPLMLSDKKTDAGVLRFVLLERLGSAVVRTVERGALEELMAAMDAV